eukprot:Hpha_TRINITY_DN15133_c5_g3::TRINITY_DN15133_c5_g3_i2::g.126983::m.126983
MNPPIWEHPEAQNEGPPHLTRRLEASAPCRRVQSPPDPTDGGQRARDRCPPPYFPRLRCMSCDGVCPRLPPAVWWGQQSASAAAPLRQPPVAGGQFLREGNLGHWDENQRRFVPDLFCVSSVFEGTVTL